MLGYCTISAVGPPPRFDTPDYGYRRLRAMNRRYILRTTWSLESMIYGLRSLQVTRILCFFGREMIMSIFRLTLNT